MESGRMMFDFYSSLFRAVGAFIHLFINSFFLCAFMSSWISFINAKLLWITYYVFNHKNFYKHWWEHYQRQQVTFEMSDTLQLYSFTPLLQTFLMTNSDIFEFLVSTDQSDFIECCNGRWTQVWNGTKMATWSFCSVKVSAMKDLRSSTGGWLVGWM